MAAIFIEDGYTLTKTIPGRPGMYPEAVVEYRPALARKRLDYGKVIGAGDPAKVETAENSLIQDHVVRLNGEAVPPGKAGKIVPELRSLILNLILGYDPADEATDLGN